MWSNGTTLPDIFDFFLAFQQILSDSENNQELREVLTDSNSPSIKLINSYFTNPMEMLLTILTDHPTHSILPISDFIQATPNSFSISPRLLSKSVSAIYRFISENKLDGINYESLLSLFIRVHFNWHLAYSFSRLIPRFLILLTTTPQQLSLTLRFISIFSLSICGWLRDFSLRKRCGKSISSF